MPKTRKHSEGTKIPSSESEQTEFKLGTAKPEQVAETVCAFLNSSGGTVFIGVNDQGRPVGVTEPARYAEHLREVLQVHVTPGALWSVSVDEVDDRKIIAVEVPEGQERPYVCNGAIFVRRGAQTLPADAAQIAGMVEKRFRTPFRWERQPAAGFDLSDLDSEEIRKAVAEISGRGRFQIANTTDASEVLYDLSLVQSGVLTNAAVILFGKNPSRNLPQTRVRATAYSTDKGGDYLDDHLFEGHAFALLSHLLTFLERNVRLVAEFEPGRMQRSDRTEYPFSALREGLMNAIAHRDYSAFDGGMSLGVYPNRIEIWNSGSLPERLSVGALKRAHPSLPPNPDIAHVFYLRGLIERIGRGTVKILEDCKAAKLPPPVWKSEKTGVTLILHGRRGTDARKRLNRRQIELLHRLEPGDQLVPGDYYVQMKGVVSQRQAQRDLSGLEAGGWLEHEGEGPATVYTRTSQRAP